MSRPISRPVREAMNALETRGYACIPTAGAWAVIRGAQTFGVYGETGLIRFARKLKGARR